MTPLTPAKPSTPLGFFLHWEKETPGRIFLRQPINDVWHAYTYQHAGDEIRRVAAYLRQLPLPPRTNIAILSKNCAHWIMTDLAIMMAGHVSVPIYPTLSAEGVRQILEHSGSQLIFAGKLDDWSKQRAALMPGMKVLTFPYYGVADAVSWDTMLQQAPLQDVMPPPPDQLATIMYSSGTTGTPKGVMLTQGAFGLVGDVVSRQLKVVKPERLFSYLPLSHIAERGLMEMVSLATGSTISFTESLDKFADNLQHEQPTIFGGVPRIYAKFQEGVLKKMPQRKLDRLLSLPLINNFIKKTIRRKLGFAEARVIVSGAAPTPVSLLKWFQRLDIPVAEVYGMTENTAFATANYNDNKLGTVGEAWEGVEVKLSEEGEVLIRHGALMTGYYRDEVTTRQVFTDDGFLRTGDKGHIDAEGFLTITGRVKDQFKTDKGKFIAPMPIELGLLANRDIGQVCVVGMGIPQPIALMVLSEQGKTKARAEIIASITKTLASVNASLESYERVEKAVILEQDWTLDNGLLTPSLKLKRNELEKIYLPQYPVWYKRDGIVVFA